MNFPNDYVGVFPELSVDNSKKTSNASKEYNCIAWAANDTTRVWWPDEDGVGYWPEGALREVTLDSFIQAYGTLGYVICSNGDLEVGFEKIAIYASSAEPKHAARQLSDGTWTSKLGFHETFSIDIKHDSPELVAGKDYGAVVQFMKRNNCSGKEQ